MLLEDKVHWHNQIKSRFSACGSQRKDELFLKATGKGAGTTGEKSVSPNF